MLLPGKYSSIQTKKAYEVRENLRNFTARKQELRFNLPTVKKTIFT